MSDAPMTDVSHQDTMATALEVSSPEFTDQDQSAFVGADAIAGKIVGYVLSISFVYTIVTGIGIIWWTWAAVSGGNTP